MSKIFPSSAAASLLTLVCVSVHHLGVFGFLEGHCSKMEYVESGRSSANVPFNSGILELEFALMGQTQVEHTTKFIIQKDAQDYIVVSVRERRNILKKVSVNFSRAGWKPCANKTEGMEQNEDFTFGVIRRALFNVSENLFTATFWNDSDNGSKFICSLSNPPDSKQDSLTFKAMVEGGSDISYLFHWVYCTLPTNCPSCPSSIPSPCTTSTSPCPPTSTEFQVCASPPTIGVETSSPYFYLLVAALAVVFLILLVLVYREIKRNIGSQKAKNESYVQNYENQDCYELDLNDVPVVPQHLRQQNLPGKESSESRDSVNSIYNYIPKN
ncbi:uncharacterized protein LOC143035318 [Oratosquilla oratoria]|uniref:uncharacterized protein LOC143035318 n=1 Tax=Oratosquilla oratoria TaxID=337810 RepID=UPI003F76F815